MKMQKIPLILKIVILLTIFSLILLSINFKSRLQKDHIIKDELKLKEKYIGKHINSIKEIIGDSLYNSHKQLSILLFTGLDCLSCVDRGIRLMKKINSSTDKQVILVKSCADINFSREEFIYHDSIFIDDKDILRMELGYIDTPVIINLDTLKSICDIYFIKE